MTYTAAQMMEIALVQIGRMTMAESQTKECRTCSRKHGVIWTLTPSDALYHRDRHGYEKHVVVDVEKKDKKEPSK